MAIHSSILAWKIPWTEEPGGLQSKGSQSQTWQKWLSMYAYIYMYVFISIYLYVFIYLINNLRSNIISHLNCLIACVCFRRYHRLLQVRGSFWSPSSMPPSLPCSSKYRSVDLVQEWPHCTWWQCTVPGPWSYPRQDECKWKKQDQIKEQLPWSERHKWTVLYEACCKSGSWRKDR